MSATEEQRQRERQWHLRRGQYLGEVSALCFLQIPSYPCVWMDGNWVFSTSLDQRIRFWIVDQKGKHIEHAHLVISVPEPEALDAQACGRNNYEITVVGRGMQMVEFSASM